jgi:hypothetical protein
MWSMISPKFSDGFSLALDMIHAGYSYGAWKLCALASRIMPHPPTARRTDGVMVHHKYGTTGAEVALPKPISQLVKTIAES